MWVPNAEGTALVNLDRCVSLAVTPVEWHNAPPEKPYLVKAFPSPDTQGFVIARYATKEEAQAHLADLIRTLGQPF